MTEKADLLLNNLRNFFDDADNAKLLESVLPRKQGLSLRALEKYVTLRAKNHCVAGQDSIYISYKATLQGYSKKLFDAFARTAKIPFHLPTGVVVRTTVGQLNFIKWSIQSGLVSRLIK